MLVRSTEKGEWILSASILFFFFFVINYLFFCFHQTLSRLCFVLNLDCVHKCIKQSPLAKIETA